MGRRLLRWGIYAACAMPLLVAVSLVVNLLAVPEGWAQGVSLALWGAAMLGLWVGLGRLLPVGDERAEEDR
jgi:hypothetical protein